MNMDDTNKAPVKPYTHQDLCNLYQVSWVTMQKWLKLIAKDVGEKVGHFYSKRQVEKIFELLGHPDGL